MRATVATEAKAIVGLVRGLGSRVHVVFEEGTQAQWLHDVLKPHAERWLAQLKERGARMRAAGLLAELDVIEELRPKAKAAMIVEARRQPGWKVLRTVPFLGPIRVAEILAIMATPWRFRTKRQAWPYVGLAVVTRSNL